MYWKEYDSFLSYWSEHEDVLVELISDGEYWYKNRFDYAWRNSMLWWRRRDRYSKNCNGDCDNCKSKNC